MDDQAALVARRVALAVAAWFNAPADVEAYRRLAAAVGEWNAYSAPQLEDGDVDELLDDLADVAPPDAAWRGRRRARGGPTSAGSPRALTPRRVAAAVGGGREFTPAAAGIETAGCRVPGRRPRVLLWPGSRGCSGRSRAS